MSKEKQGYYINIHHRNISVSKDINEKLQQEKSYGHFYLSLEGPNVHKYYGKYPKEGNFFNNIIGQGLIETDEEELTHINVTKLSKNNPDKALISTKKITVSKEQFEAAHKYAYSRQTGETQEGTYIVGVADCTDFVQAVYNAAGLPLYFTSIYTSQELKELGTEAASNVLRKYASRDSFKSHFSNIEGLNKEALANKLNIDSKQVKPLKGSLELDKILPSFEITLKECDLLASKLFTNLEQNKEPHKTNIPEVTSSLAEAIQDDQTNLEIHKFFLTFQRKQKIDKIKLKLLNLFEDYEEKVNKIYHQFIIDQNNMLQNQAKGLADALLNEAEKIKKDNEAYNQNIFQQKAQELAIETENKFSLIKAQAVPGGSIVLNNTDIRDRKQSEYEALISKHKMESEKNYENLHNKYALLSQNKVTALKSEVENKAKFIHKQKEEYLQSLSEVVQYIERVILAGDDIDIDKMVQCFDDKSRDDIQILQTIRTEDIPKALQNNNIEADQQLILSIKNNCSAPLVSTDIDNITIQELMEGFSAMLLGNDAICE